MGIATPTESASVGAAGAAFLAFFRKQLNFKNIVKLYNWSYKPLYESKRIARIIKQRIIQEK